MALHEAEPGAGGPSQRLGGKYEVLASAPLEELNAPNARAYRATNRERPGEALYALVCEPGLPPRQDWLDRIGVLRVESLVTPLVAGVIDWPPAGRRSFAILFEVPGGPRLVAAANQTITPFSEEEMIAVAVPTLLAAMRGLYSTGLTHRAIRPSNLFYRSAADRRLILGECVSGPAGSAQPLAYETIEGGLAMPYGRGAGTSADDLYALGVLLVFLMLGRDPAQGVPDERLLLDKMTRGSYAALASSARLPLRIAEAVRGLLADDPRERWSLQELDHWTQGRRVSAKQFAMAKRAGRPFELGGTGCETARALAYEMARDPATALRAIRSPDFEIWLQRSLADPERSSAVATALSDASVGDGAASDARLVARVCLALDPAAPIRYGGIGVMVDGFGTALAAAFQGRCSTAAIAEALIGRLPQFWLTMQGDLKTDQTPLLKNFEQLRQRLEDKRPGFGIERLLYELNPALHCLSPPIEKACVVDASDLLRALEAAAKTGELGDTLIDRHLAGFIAARFRNAGTDWHESLGGADPRLRALATLQILARLQSLRGPEVVPALSERLGRELPAFVDRFHSRERRAKLKAGIGRLAAKGSLPELLNLLASPAELSRDDSDFARAKRECAGITRTLRALQANAPSRPAQAAELGGRYAVAAANLLAWIVVAASVALRR